MALGPDHQAKNLDALNLNAEQAAGLYFFVSRENVEPVPEPSAPECESGGTLSVKAS